MAKVTQFKELSRTKKKKSGLKAFLIFLPIAAVSIFLSVFWNDVAELFVGSGPKGSFPVSITNGTPKQIAQLGNYFAVSTSANLSIYNRSGGVVQTILHGYTNPVLQTNDKYTLLYDRGGKGLRIDNRTKNLRIEKFDSQIITAELSSDGAFAVVTASRQYLNELIVYDKGYEVIFKWSSMNENIVKTAFTKDGKGIVVAAVAPNADGEITSSLYYFSFQKNELVATQKVENACIIDISIKSANEFVAVFDTLIAKFKLQTMQMEEKYLFEPKQLISFDIDSPNHSAIALTNNVKDTLCEIIVLSDSFQEACRVSDVHALKSVKCHENKLCILTDSAFMCYQVSGAAIKNNDAIIANAFVAIKENIYLLGYSEINQLTIH